MIRGYSPIAQALFASLFTWAVTALGSAVVFVTRSNSKKLLDASLGFAAGVMTAASFWSLLAPAIDISEATYGKWAFAPVAVGFLFGAALFLFGCLLSEMTTIDYLAHRKSEPHEPDHQQLSRIEPREEGATRRRRGGGGRREEPKQEEEGLPREGEPNLRRGAAEGGGEITEEATVPLRAEDSTTTRKKQDEEHATSWRRILLLIMAVTVHNIPEGLAVGVGFGSIGKSPAASFESAFNLALGIGLQNFPEGLAVSLPLAGFGWSKWRAFWYGQLSGMVEPLAALLGAFAVIAMEPVLPYALAFAAGAMIYVVVDDIIPEAQQHGNAKLASCGAIAGFIVMMSLDVGLG